MNETGIAGLVSSLKEKRKNGGIISVSGMTGGASALTAARLAKEAGGQILIIVSSREKARQIEEFLTFLRLTGRFMFCRKRNAPVSV